MAVTSMVKDMNDNIIVGGTAGEKYHIDQQFFGEDSIRDIFICSFSAIDGKLMWIKESDTQPSNLYEWAYLHELAVTEENNLLVMGNFRTDTYTLGRHVMTFQGKQNLFIASLNINHTKSLPPTVNNNCPLHVNYTSGNLLLKDECPEQRIQHLKIFTLSGQKLSIIGTRKTCWRLFIKNECLASRHVCLEGGKAKWKP